MSVPPDQLDRQAAYAAAVAPTGGAPGHPAMLPPPTPPAAPLPYPGYMSPQDLAAFALQTIQQAYQPQIDYLRQQQAQSQQMHAAQQAGLAQLYQILAGSMGNLGGQIGDIYNSAAQGLNLPSDAVTGDLGVSRNIVDSGALAGPGYGSAYPQLAGQQGQTEFLKAVQEGNAADQDITAQIQKLIAEQPAQVQQLLSQLTGQQADYAKAAQPTLEKVGDSLLQIDPTTGKVRVIYQGPAAAGKVAGYDASLSAQVGYLVDKNRQPILDAKGKPIPYTPSGSDGQTRLTFQTIKGRRVGVDPYTGEIKVDYGPAGTGSTKPSNLQIKTIPINGVNHQVAINPRNGKVVVDYGPTRKTGPAGGKESGTAIFDSTGTEITKGQVKSYSQDTVATIRAGLQHGGSLEQIIASLQKSPIPTAVWRPVVAKRFGVPTWAVRGVKSEGQTSQLRYMGVSRLHNIAVFLGYQPDPARPLDKRGLIGWIQAHVPKAEAAQGAAYSPARAANQTQAISYTDWPDMIRSGAAHYGLDPLAVLAVANAEGLGGGVGDNGTSFGPFQLHVGGALPRGKTQAWAESPAGIDYALRQIASVARGLTARQAIEMIVRRFERPADPEGEIERAWAYYQSQFA